MSVERGPARWGAVAVIPGRVVAGGQLVKLHPNYRIATLISRDEVATSAEGMYGSLRHLVKPILEKISVATRTWTASLKPTNSSLVPTSLKTWYPRSLLLTGSRHGSSGRLTRMLVNVGIRASPRSRHGSSAGISAAWSDGRRGFRLSRGPRPGSLSSHGQPWPRRMNSTPLDPASGVSTGASLRIIGSGKAGGGGLPANR